MAEPITIDMEPTWEACAHIYMLVMEQGETAKGREDEIGRASCRERV